MHVQEVEITSDGDLLLHCATLRKDTRCPRIRTLPIIVSQNQRESQYSTEYAFPKYFPTSIKWLCHQVKHHITTIHIKLKRPAQPIYCCVYSIRMLSASKSCHYLGILFSTTKYRNDISGT